MSDKRITRRQALLGIGGIVGAGYVAQGCNSDEGGEMPMPDAGEPPPDLATNPDMQNTINGPLGGIESIVVLMMENRSFDHFLGALKSDAIYKNASTVDGLTGNETNPAPNGDPVKVFNMTNFTPADPPHSWSASHQQWDSGMNDGFVKAHAGSSQNDVMGYHDRAQIPFYYWLADNFTVCDRWHASVMGPTWPNRYYLHACSSGGKKDNTPYISGGPTTLWSRMKDAGQSFKNYRAGVVAWYTGGFLGQSAQINPVVPLSEFFDDAKSGKLPAFSIIDPDFQAADDHPSHDIIKGQVFVASIYKAIAESPQWPRTLFVIIYDEHGGFYDHVSPGMAYDDAAEFQQYGFRIPAFVIGGMVKRSHLNHTLFDHCSVGATLATRFGIPSLNQRMTTANDLSSCIDPDLVKNPAPPPPGMPMPMMKWGTALDRIGEWSQPELDQMIRDGRIPRHMIDVRTSRETTVEWLTHASRLGAVQIR
jgi:phospholipase C